MIEVVEVEEEQEEEEDIRIMATEETFKDTLEMLPPLFIQMLLHTIQVSAIMILIFLQEVEEDKDIQLGVQISNSINTIRDRTL
jgi:hypothetical protein